MLSGYDDAYRTFSNNVSAPWVADDGETVVVDANLMKWVDQTKLYTEKGYNHKSSLWDATWAADQARPARSRLLLLHLGHQLHPAGQLSGNFRR